MKKIVTVLLIVCVFVICSCKINAYNPGPLPADQGGSGIFAINRTGSVYNSIPSYNGENTFLSDLKLESKAYKQSKFMTYKSYYTGEVQKTLLDSEACVVYSAFKLIDAPTSCIEQFGLEPYEYKTTKFLETYNNSVSSTEAQSISNSFLTSFEDDHKISLGVVADMIEFGASNAYKFKISDTLYNTFSNSVTRSSSYMIQKETVEHYHNNTSQPIYVMRGTRQKFKAYITYRYQYNYSVTKKGVHFLGKDTVYTYNLDNMKCISTNITLVPVDLPYYKVSYYSYDYDNRKNYIGATETTMLYL